MELRNDRGGILAMSCTEIKDNRMFDLLQADDDSDLLKPVLIKNVSRHHVESSGSAKHTFWKANAKRTAVRGNLQAPVHVYDFIVTLYYWSTSEHYTLPGSKCSKVQIAELAGVGRDSMKPLKHQIQANRAAMELSQLLEHIVKVNAKDDKRNSIKHMKSSSTLTMLKYFHDSLLKQYTTLRVICHIRPELELLNTNISVLEFGKSLRRLSTSTVDVPVSSPESMQLYIQTEHLAHELHLCGRMQGQRSMGTMTAKRYERLRNSVLNFLKSETDDIVLAKRNFVDIFTLLSVLREYHDKITNEENNEKTRNTLKFAPFLLKSLLVDKNAVKQTTEKVQQAVNQTLPVSTTGPEYWEAFVAENPSDFFEYEQMCAEIRDAQRLFEIDSKEILKYQENVLQLRDKMDKFRRLRYLSGIEEYEASTGNVIVPDKEKLMFQNIKRADAELTKVNENFVQKLNHLNRISAEHIKMNMDIHSRFTVQCF
ncbi:Hypothetical protein CINCED_3A021496 [Cinara cedri]|uniref:Kinesin motor domain-containing protein n=1 Tax=Cinara cedri TaxID=506608 RepID=A0A5E4LXN7_9HEMI|nr:Hypothetical protein CINCED_3A021496 [Cinara cedri]